MHFMHLVNSSIEESITIEHMLLILLILLGQVLINLSFIRHLGSQGFRFKICNKKLGLSPVQTIAGGEMSPGLGLTVPCERSLTS